jgi:ribosome-dependent ATPase
MRGENSIVAELREVTHRYGNTLALENVTLQLPSQSMIGLIGPDGVGKSTLLALIAGVRKIQEGKVEALDGDMGDQSHRRYCVNHIAYMPQGLGKNLYPTLSVFENLDFFGRLFGHGKQERKSRIDELLSATGLAPFRHRPAGKLSGGMKQKLGLCCALIHDPDLLILDEPTTGIDPLSRQRFWKLIEVIRGRRSQMTIIVATAYMEEADLFDWIVALDDGKIIATGTPSELKSAAHSTTLETAFIRLLPEKKRLQHQEVVVPPRSGMVGDIAIEATGLTKKFGDFTAVDQVSFSIGRGEIFGFLGSNGCGKTTTMKMLTGLLPATSGEAKLFGKPLNARDMLTRRRVGYMSQSFSLYGELSVLQNLELHAYLFHLPANERKSRIDFLLEKFSLRTVKNSKPAGLPLGVKQRLQLAVAVLHEPEILILDEPTSGVDPVARDDFWRLLIDLSRNRGVTIFISTHFMNEAERCDRISLMHAGRVLGVGTPQELVASKKAVSLDEAFINYLQDAIDEKEVEEKPLISDTRDEKDYLKLKVQGAFSLRRMWAYATRETKELLRDPIRLAFALIGPMILMVTFGYGISFDVEELPYAVLDEDSSLESRQFLENFSGSLYFDERQAITTASEVQDRLKSGELKFVIEIPAGFGKDLITGQQAEVGVWLDGAMPFRAETARGYIQGVTQQFLAERTQQTTGSIFNASPVSIETRFLYNQAFKSAYAITPGVIMFLCIMIPAMMTAVGIVREKELGSITNLYATPVTKTEFLLGKQIPYIFIAYISFLTLVVMVLGVFSVPLKGSVLALLVGGGIYVWATTGFGMLISAFVKSQIAAIFATAIVAMVLTMNFSGFLTPVSTLSGGAKFMSLFFPAPYFQQISVGSFTKALSYADLWPSQIALVMFALVFFAMAAFLLKKQER